MLRDYSPHSLDNKTYLVEEAWKKARDDELGLLASCVEPRRTIPSRTELKILRFCLSTVKDEKGRAVKVCAGCKSCDGTMQYKKRIRLGDQEQMVVALTKKTTPLRKFWKSSSSALTTS